MTDLNGRSVLCNCIKQRLFDINFNKSNIGNLKKENFENFKQTFEKVAKQEKVEEILPVIYIDGTVTRRRNETRICKAIK